MFPSQHVWFSLAFASVAPTVWNLLPEDLRHPADGHDQFGHDLKRFLSAELERLRCNRIGGFTNVMGCINLHLLTYLITVKY